MTQQQLVELLAEARSRREPVALATVVRVRGSAPRGPGARMLVCADGATHGSVSGGCLEAEVFARAQQVLRTGVAERFQYDLTRDVEEGEGMVCGGVVEVLVERVA